MNLRTPAATTAVTVAALVSPLATGAADAAAPVGHHPFVRTWSGHTRTLDVRADHTAKESVYSGCCDHVIDVWFTVRDPRGSERRGSVAARVTRVRVYDPAAQGHHRPHRGERTRFTVRNGVLTEPLTGTTYCNHAAGSRGVCGA